ncbi:MAG: hypothetical protein ACYCWW_15555, partial [Deltaproteobacteria bacterium]
MARRWRTSSSALLAIGLVFASSLGFVYLLKRPAFANTLCRAGASLVGRELGLSVAVGSCRVEPLSAKLILLDVLARDPVSAGREVAIDSIELALRPLQAVAGGLWVRRLGISGLRVTWRAAPRPPAPPRLVHGPCWIDWLRIVHVEELELHRAQLALNVGGEPVDVASLEVETRLRSKVYRGTVEAKGQLTGGAHGRVRTSVSFGLDPRAKALSLERFALEGEAGGLLGAGEIRDV